MSTSDTQPNLSDAHQTAVLWTRDSGWLDPTDMHRRASGVTPAEKLARLAEALEDLPRLAAELSRLSAELSRGVDQLSRAVDQVVGILESTKRIVDGATTRPASSACQICPPTTSNAVSSPPKPQPVSMHLR